MRLIPGLLLAVVAMNVWAASDSSTTEQKLIDAIKHERRSTADTARDANRKPLETLKFFQLRDDMKVLELLPGGGWYTKILAPTLEAKGKLYISLGRYKAYPSLRGWGLEFWYTNHHREAIPVPSCHREVERT